MKILLTIIVGFVTIGHVFGQVKRDQLVGEWIASNKDSLFYKSDTIEFIQDANWLFEQQICDVVKLRVSKGDFKFISSNNCTEPGRESWTNGKQTIRVRNGKTLEISILDKIEMFAIIDFKEERIDRYPYDIKKLKLKRL